MGLKLVMARQTHIIAVTNQKGGVGKTTTAVNLATALVACGKQVLLVDFDPQGNASTGLGVEDNMRQTNSYRLLTGEAPVTTCIYETIVPNLHLVPATMDLSAVEVEFSDIEGREYRLKTHLAPIHGHYDYILIDCPPSLGLLTVNALSAANAVLVPLQCEFYALEGLAQLLRTVEAVRGHLNPALVMQGIVLTMFDSRNKLSEMVESDVRAHFGAQVYQTVIPRNVRISEAPSFGKPVLIYDIKCAGSQAYAALAAEVLQQERKVA